MLSRDIQYNICIQITGHVKKTDDISVDLHVAEEQRARRRANSPQAADCRHFDRSLK